MQLQQPLQTQITGGQRHLQAEKVRPTKLRWMKWQKAVWRTVATVGPPTLPGPSPSPPRSCFQKISARFGKIVSVLLTCFSQLGERDLSPLFLVGTNRVVYAVFARSCKSNTADFGKRCIERYTTQEKKKRGPSICPRRLGESPRPPRTKGKKRLSQDHRKDLYV